MRNLRVASNRSLVRLAAFTTKCASLDVLLSIVPGTTRSVQEECHEDTSDGRKHEHRGNDFSSKKRLASCMAQNPEDDACGSCRLYFKISS